MKTFITFFFCLISYLAFAQNNVQLRDVSFTVPEKFVHILKENKKVKYSAYYENGKVRQDTLSENMSSQILYQYYENPAYGTEHPEVVLKRLNDYIAKDFKLDTLIINPDAYYSVARYNTMGMAVYEIKSLGESGWLNIQYLDFSLDVANSTGENLKAAEVIAKSVKHSGEYGGEYRKHVEEGANSSKYLIIFIIIFIAATAGGRFVKKQQEKEKETK